MIVRNHLFDTCSDTTGQQLARCRFVKFLTILVAAVASSRSLSICVDVLLIFAYVLLRLLFALSIVVTRDLFLFHAVAAFYTVLPLSVSHCVQARRRRLHGTHRPRPRHTAPHSCFARLPLTSRAAKCPRHSKRVGSTRHLGMCAHRYLNCYDSEHWRICLK